MASTRDGIPLWALTDPPNGPAQMNSQANAENNLMRGFYTRTNWIRATRDTAVPFPCNSDGVQHNISSWGSNVGGTIDSAGSLAYAGGGGISIVETGIYAVSWSTDAWSDTIIGDPQHHRDMMVRVDPGTGSASESGARIGHTSHKYTATTTALEVQGGLPMTAMGAGFSWNAGWTIYAGVYQNAGRQLSVPATSIFVWQIG